MTVYVYDCEFLEDGSTIDLISIGICCEDGREYYAVNSDMDEKRIKMDKWLCENVIPSLPLRGDVNRHSNPTGGYYWSLNTQSTVVKPKWVIANEVREFLLEHTAFTPGTIRNEPELWAYYGAYDHVALAQLFGKMIHLPKGLPMWTRDLMELKVEIEFPEQPNGQHNALEDARWGMAAYRLAREHGLV